MTWSSSDHGDGSTAIRTFLIADIRGYTRFTAEHGDEAASRLAARFAEIAAEGVEAWGGVTLDTQELISIARASLTRGFDQSECTRFNLDPCPTLDELKAAGTGLRGDRGQAQLSTPVASNRQTRHA